MRERCTPILICFLLWNFIGQITAQTYQVQLAAFTEDIEHSFFDFAGYSEVYKEKDHNNFTKYTLGEYFTIEAANAVRQEAFEKGFSNVHIIELDKPQFAYVGDAPVLPLLMVPEKEQLFIRSVQFTAKDLSLKKSLLAHLEEALTILKNHPDLKLRIVGHTDNIGEQSVNQAISKDRARMVQNFLLANGIPAYRLKMKVADTPSPTVYFKGKGLPKTRDFNRRIILTLVDLKEEIVVDNFQGKGELKSQLSAVDDIMQLLKSIKLV